MTSNGGLLCSPFPRHPHPYPPHNRYLTPARSRMQVQKSGSVSRSTASGARGHSPLHGREEAATSVGLKVSVSNSWCSPHSHGRLRPSFPGFRRQPRRRRGLAKGPQSQPPHQRDLQTHSDLPGSTLMHSPHQIRSQRRQPCRSSFARITPPPGSPHPHLPNPRTPPPFPRRHYHHLVATALGPHLAVPRAA